jgi:hypothetical protein
MTLTAPPGSADNRALVGARLQEARREVGTRETVTVEWRGQPRSIEVITVPVGILYYNPETHRIRAQRDHEPARDEKLRADPWSPGSQEYLHFLLRADPRDPSREDNEFTYLMEDLQEYGQKDPGIITPSGILVNGNTRRAALKELGRENIRVGVVPDDWAWDDVAAIELELQLRKDHRREYSYINQLLAIDDEAVRGLSAAEINKKFRIQQKTYQQARWILAFIREAIDRSKVTLADGATTSLRLIDFEDQQEKLKELQRKYHELESKNLDAADQVREERLIAIALGKAKTDVRWIDEGFGDNYFSDKLPPELRSAGSAGGNSVTIPGLGISVAGSSEKVKQAREIANKVLRAKAVAAVPSKATPSEISEANAILSATDDAVERAITAAGRDGRLRRRKLRAPEKISDAAELLMGSCVDIVQARSQNLLDEEALDDSLQELRDALIRLTRQASRSVSDAGEGLRWFQLATENQD